MSAGVPSKRGDREDSDGREGKRFRVTDTPTPLDFEIGLLTHFTVIPVGWRIQGTDESGDSLVFDIGQFAADRDWHVIRTYR